jgi:hypothetical protein
MVDKKIPSVMIKPALERCLCTVNHQIIALLISSLLHRVIVPLRSDFNFMEPSLSGFGGIIDGFSFFTLLRYCYKDNYIY